MSTTPLYDLAMVEFPKQRFPLLLWQGLVKQVEEENHKLKAALAAQPILAQDAKDARSDSVHLAGGAGGEVQGPRFQAGDIVASTDPAYSLHSGSFIYDCAVVACVDPLVLVSTTADMRWSHTVRPEKLRVIDKASAAELKICQRRLDDHEANAAILSSEQSQAGGGGEKEKTITWKPSVVEPSGKVFSACAFCKSPLNCTSNSTCIGEVRKAFDA